MKSALLACGMLGAVGHAHALTLVAFNVPTTNLLVGGSSSLTVLLDSAAPSLTTITLSASNPAVVAISDLLLVPEGSASASFDVTGVGLGTSEIFAYLGLDSVSTEVNVVATLPAVPEPGAWALMAAGLMAVGGMVRRRAAATTRLGPSPR